MNWYRIRVNVGIYVGKLSLLVFTGLVLMMSYQIILVNSNGGVNWTKLDQILWQNPYLAPTAVVLTLAAIWTMFGLAFRSAKKDSRYSR